MKLRFYNLNIIIVCLFLSSCSNFEKEYGTMIIHGGTIYTVDSAQTTIEAVVTKNETILFAGGFEEAKSYQNEQTELIDLKGKTMTPGLIEGHGHFMGLGYNELELNLMNTRSYQDIVDAVAEKVKTSKPGEWIIGRGWHQS